MSGSVLNQIADILKGGKGKCNDDGSIFIGIGSGSNTRR